MNGIQYSVGIDPRAAVAGLATVRGALAGLSGIAARLAPLTGLTAGLGLVGGAVLGFKKAISEAARMEGLESGFTVLLGSAQAGTERMRELAQFAAATPFELPAVAQASRTLETLTKGALSTGKGLKLVGDVASVTQQPFGDLATWIGRLYDGLESGRPVGEAMARLQELGVVSGDVRDRIESLQKEGQKGDAAWSVMEGALGRFSGMMNVQSRTWDGKMSTLRDGVSEVFREFGKPLIDSLSPILDGGISLAQTMAATARDWGESMAAAVATTRALFASGQLGNAAGQALKIGFGAAINFLMNGLRGAVAMSMEGWSQTGEVLRDSFSLLGDPKLWGGALDMMSALAGSFVTALASALAPVLDQLIGVLNKIPGVKIDFKAEDLADRFKGVTDDLWESGKEKLGAAFSAPLGNLQDRMGRSLEAFKSGFASGDLLNMGPEIAELTATLAAIAPAVGKGAPLNGFMDPREMRAANQGMGGGIGGAGAAAITPLSDRLAKIGGFIGGPGGARGEKAQMDTARSSAKLVELTRGVLDQLKTGSLSTGSLVF